MAFFEPQDADERRLASGSFVWCERCATPVKLVEIDRLRKGWRITARCHGRALARTVTRTEVEDTARLSWFKPLTPIADVTLSVDAARIFAVLTALNELHELQLVEQRRGSIVPTLSLRGRQYAESQQARNERVRSFMEA